MHLNALLLGSMNRLPGNDSPNLLVRVACTQRAEADKSLLSRTFDSRVFPGLYLIASGGVSGMADIRALEDAGVPAVIFGKALYEGRITMKEIESLIIHN